MYDEISELRLLQSQKSRLLEKEAVLSAPLLTDTGYIRAICEWFGEIQAVSGMHHRLRSVHCRKQFILIVIFLYSPATLAGGRMLTGLRNKIAEAFDIRDVTFISHNIENIVFMYSNYKEFRSEVDHLFAGIMERLKREGILLEKMKYPQPSP